MKVSSYDANDTSTWMGGWIANTVCTLAGGIFKLELFLPEDYPMTPPKIRFLTKIFHPNVDKLGRICLDVLKSRTNDTPPTCLCLQHGRE